MRRAGPRSTLMGTQLSKERTQVSDEEFRLLQGRKVASGRHLSPVRDEVQPFGPRPGDSAYVSGVDRAPRGHVHPGRAS